METKKTYKPSTFLYDANVTRFNSLVTPDLSSQASSQDIAKIQPHALAAKARSNPEDNPTYDDAMSGEHQSDYYNAALVELKMLQEDLDCWELVCKTYKMNVLPSTWAFKCKRYPDG
jgi:hypothetical protein